MRVGAHPGYADREHFGRKAVELPAEAVENLVLFQVAALDGFVRSRGGTLTHVKPHGALYHAGAQFPDVARAIAEGVRRFRVSLVLVGAAGSMLIEAGREAGLAVAEEAFADRRYLPDGTTVPRGEPRALITDPDEAAEQAVLLARDRVAVAIDGSRVSVRADTLCLHGDTPGAGQIARRIHERFRAEGIRIAPLESGRPSRHDGSSSRPGSPFPGPCRLFVPMGTEEAELPGEDEDRSWRDRVGAVTAAGQGLLATRMAILREELAGKAALAARGLAAIVIAAALAVGALLLLAALLAALLAGIFKSVVLGILVAVILYGAGAAVAIVIAWKALTRVRPLEFPAVTQELARDWQAVAESLSPADEADDDAAGADGEDGNAIVDLEERFREGSE